MWVLFLRERGALSDHSASNSCFSLSTSSIAPIHNRHWLSTYQFSVIMGSAQMPLSTLGKEAPYPVSWGVFGRVGEAPSPLHCSPWSKVPFCIQKYTSAFHAKSGECKREHFDQLQILKKSSCFIFTIVKWSYKSSVRFKDLGWFIHTSLRL